MNNFEPDALLILHDMEPLRVLADPLRGQIYEVLLQEPATIKQVAARLGLTASRLYYHVNLMEKLGLLRVVETRMVANILEKVYRSAAYRLDVAPELLDFSSSDQKETLAEIMVGGLDATREDMLRSLHARISSLEQGEPEKNRSITVARTTARIADEYAVEFHARLNALIEEFQGKDQPGDGRQTYALTVAFYPSFYFSGEESPSPTPDPPDQPGEPA